MRNRSTGMKLHIERSRPEPPPMRSAEEPYPGAPLASRKAPAATERIGYPVPCPACNGTGGLGPYNDCPACDGNGVI